MEFSLQKEPVKSGVKASIFASGTPKIKPPDKTNKLPTT